MRILLVHSRYRSGAPSGENRVVDQEGEALEALGHEVVRFGRSSELVIFFNSPLVTATAISRDRATGPGTQHR